MYFDRIKQHGVGAFFAKIGLTADNDRLCDATIARNKTVTSVFANMHTGTTFVPNASTMNHTTWIHNTLIDNNRLL